MLNIIKQLLGLGPKVDYRNLVQSGAVILDVRTPAWCAQRNGCGYSEEGRNGSLQRRTLERTSFKNLMSSFRP